MANACRICGHSNRLEIDREIVKGGNLAKIAKNFGVPYHSLYSHAQEHVSRQLAQVYEKRQLNQDFDLLSKIDSIISRAEKIFKRNYEAQKDGIALKALDSQRSTIELLAKISYSLHQAKLAEIELLHQQSGDTDQHEAEKFQKLLGILTIAELEMFQKLQDKIINQTPTVILPDEYPTKTVLSPDYPDRAISITQTQQTPLKGFGQGQKRQRTKVNGAVGLEVEELDIIQPVQPEVIQYTPWQEHPLNGKKANFVILPKKQK